MKQSYITNRVYKIILLAYVTLGVAGGLFTLSQGSESILMSLVALSLNSLILVLYWKRNRYLNLAVKIEAAFIIAISTMLFFSSGFISMFYGGEILLLTLLSVALIGLGVYLFTGSNKYIQIENVQE